jgi:hypothetical protein
VDDEPRREVDRERAVGGRYPLEVKLRIGAQVAAGLPPGGLALLAQALRVSERTLREWKKLFLKPESERPKMGRPRASEAQRASLRTAIVAVQDEHNWLLSGRGVHRLIKTRTSLYRVQEIVQALRAERVRRLREQAEMRRLHVHAHARDVLWSLDGTHLGRDARARETRAEMVRDVSSTKTLGARIGPAPSAEDVVALLDRIVLETDALPLAIASDNGPENRAALEGWCKAHEVLHLWSLPRTPQHNPWVEHGNAELKAQTGLGKGRRIQSISEVAMLVLGALDHIDGSIPRVTRGNKTAREAYRDLPAAQAVVNRTALYREAHCAIAEAVQGCRSARERRLAERRAILATLERHGVITQTRGRMPKPDRKVERLL